MEKLPKLSDKLRRETLTDAYDASREAGCRWMATLSEIEAAKERERHTRPDCDECGGPCRDWEPPQDIVAPMWRRGD